MRAKTSKKLAVLARINPFYFKILPVFENKRLSYCFDIQFRTDYKSFNRHNCLFINLCFVLEQFLSKKPEKGHCSVLLVDHFDFSNAVFRFL
jgi:hypothetical protein